MKELIHFIEEEKLALIKFRGLVDMSTVDSRGRVIISEFEKSGYQKCIIDLRDTSFQFEYQHVSQIYDSFKKLYAATLYVNWVFITNSPKSTILVLLFIKNVEETKSNAIQCSTLDYAIQFLNAKSSTDKIKSILEELSYSLVPSL